MQTYPKHKNSDQVPNCGGIPHHFSKLLCLFNSHLWSYHLFCCPFGLQSKTNTYCCAASRGATLGSRQVTARVSKGSGNTNIVDTTQFQLTTFDVYGISHPYSLFFWLYHQTTPSCNCVCVLAHLGVVYWAHFISMVLFGPIISCCTVFAVSAGV